MKDMEKTDIRAENVDKQQLLDQYKALRETAQRDALTGLLNRGAMERRINERLEKMSDTDDCAMLMIDLDNFKTVNDTLGHQNGDMVLQRAAKVLSGMFRATDIVGRLGGDEFVVFLSGAITEEAVRRKGHMVCDQLQFFVGTKSQILVSASVGIHMSHGGLFDNIYHAADQALYKAKNSGKSCYCLTKSEKGIDAPDRFAHAPVNAIRLQALLDHIDSGVAMIRTSDPLSFIYVSPAFTKMIHMTTEELTQTDVLSLIHPDDREGLSEMLKDTVRERRETISHVARITARGSRMMWWRIHASCVEYTDNEYVALITVVDISELKEKEKYMDKDKNLLQTAMDQAAQGIWELDWKSKMFRLVGKSRIFPEEIDQKQSFPEDLIKNRWIHPDSVESFRSFARDIFNGRLQGYATFKIRFREGDLYEWASFSYRTALDENGLPRSVVGIIEGMSGEGAQYESKYGTAPLPESLMPSWVLRVQGNLTKDVTQSCWIEGKDVSGSGIYQTCTEILTAERGKAFTPERGERFSKFLSREALLVSFLEEDTRWIMHEYRRTDQGGNIQWILCVIHLYQQKGQSDVEFRMMVSKCSLRHRWESQFGISIYKDPDTLLYRRSTATELARHLIEMRKPDQCALVIIEISGRNRLFTQDSDSLDKKWRAVLTALMLSVGTDCIPGEFASNQYSLFFPRVKSESALKRRLEQAFQFVRAITADCVDVNQLRFSAVGVCRHNTDTEYGVLEKIAQDLRQLWSNASGDKVIFASEKKESSEQLWMQNSADSVGLLIQETRRPLTDREKDVVIKGLMEIIQSETIADSAKGVLRRLGEHYNADRVYILMPTEKGRVVIMSHEWTSNEKHSIQKSVSGMLLEKIPLLERCVKENQPVFLTRNARQTSDPSSQHADTWRFAVFPMRDEGQFEAYLCIENAREYITDATLPEMMISCLLKERRKVTNNNILHREDVLSLEEYLPNNSAYIEAIYNYNSDQHTSLGTVVVDIPDISVINSRQGFEYGRKMILFIVRLMSDIFGKVGLYRTWDAEFVALCPNTMQQIFYAKCIRLRAALTRRYPKEIRMGYTWSDKVFTGKELVQEAKLIMERTASVESEATQSILPASIAPSDPVNLDITAGRLTVLFQPRINLKDGSLSGMEALVRGLDEEGHLLAPIQFIDELEKDGTIRNLDLFVLDYAMKTMDRWIKAGVKPFPISVNFSYTTLMHSRIKASILAIQSRYPDVPEHLIEVELTESTCDLSLSTLTEVIDGLREYGIQFALDGFGAKYSNLSVLANIPLSRLKLDRSVVADIASNKNNQSLLRNIVNVCAKKDIICVGMGVETKEQEAVLKNIKCGEAQGFYYDRPLTENMFFERYLNERRNQESN